MKLEKNADNSRYKMVLRDYHKNPNEPTLLRYSYLGDDLVNSQEYKSSRYYDKPPPSYEETNQYNKKLWEQNESLIRKVHKLPGHERLT